MSVTGNLSTCQACVISDSMSDEHRRIKLGRIRYLDGYTCPELNNAKNDVNHLYILWKSSCACSVPFWSIGEALSWKVWNLMETSWEWLISRTFDASKVWNVFWPLSILWKVTLRWIFNVRFTFYCTWVAVNHCKDVTLQHLSLLILPTSLLCWDLFLTKCFLNYGSFISSNCTPLFSSFRSIACEY